MQKTKTFNLKKETVVTLPENFHIQPNTDFYIVKDEFGAIVLIPENEYSKLHQNELIKNYTTRELN